MFDQFSTTTAINERASNEMRSAVLVAVVAVVAVLGCTGCNGLYFHIKENEERCFIEEVPDETMVVGKYKTQAQNPDGTFQETSPGFGIHVEVTDPNDDIIMSKDYEAEGRFAFTAHDPGEHIICMHTNSSRWFSGRTVRVHLDILVGENTNDYRMIAKKEQLNTVETRIFQLISQVKQIANEQAYQRTREASFRALSESTNQRVLWWSIAQAVVLLLTAFWQVRHLKSFFEAKKLV
ncbi:transmembrane emp24 domain-containing protein 4 [Salpingoeca rosetta]|uniref:Transmembrane emp24 domain-containing protein 4 n=1 Tax=Salpingoeca rosetta (strain ATCC 50818 / BSB-021) TaxID=946362 RepID=F2UBA9_SALR5|nr:transmembrane emp24 domain-containing protein 4 [Salpingoeca rosetta]EGD73775.1 transmembrane emp24 domain-containing protein 4 [Salpingoeca rosetta]|eukprot:XP_004993338.1 transmembrane emp24 domain-containing protein 4 [Salpingoeca rosetta]